MSHDPFGPLWKFLAQLFGEFGGISKIGIVNIDILRDDRFDPSADTISCLSLLNPDRPQQFVDVAGFDLRDREFSDGRVSVPFERRRPLIAMLLAPGRPMLANVGFGTFLESGQSGRDLDCFRFLARRSLLLHDVDAGCAAIAFDAKTRRIASKLERLTAMRTAAAAERTRQGAFSSSSKSEPLRRAAIRRRRASPERRRRCQAPVPARSVIELELDALASLATRQSVSQRKVSELFLMSSGKHVGEND